MNKEEAIEKLANFITYQLAIDESDTVELTDFVSTLLDKYEPVKKELDEENLVTLIEKNIMGYNISKPFLKVNYANFLATMLIQNQDKLFKEQTDE